jgi:hypothetical protein
VVSALAIEHVRGPVPDAAGMRAAATEAEMHAAMGMTGMSA